MPKLFRSKKREAPAGENLGPADSPGTAKNTTEYEGKETASDTERLVDWNPNANPGLGVKVLHEPSDPTATVVE